MAGPHDGGSPYASNPSQDMDISADGSGSGLPVTNDHFRQSAAARHGPAQHEGNNARDSVFATSRTSPRAKHDAPGQPEYQNSLAGLASDYDTQRTKSRPAAAYDELADQESARFSDRSHSVWNSVEEHQSIPYEAASQPNHHWTHHDLQMLNARVDSLERLHNAKLNDYERRIKDLEKYRADHPCNCSGHARTNRLSDLERERSMPPSGPTSNAARSRSVNGQQRIPGPLPGNIIKNQGELLRTQHDDYSAFQTRK